MALNTGAALWGEPLDMTRHVIVTATSLVLAWAIGDAAGRRAAVTSAIEDELQVREQSGHLRAQLKATQEQLRIAQELHRLVGEALDAIVVHAGAARLRPDAATVDRELTTIEAIGRDVLAQLDRFLGLLRSRREAMIPDDAGWTPPVPIAHGRRLPRALAPLVSVGVLVGPVAVLLVLTSIENFSVPASAAPSAPWVLLLTCAATLPLLLRRRWPRLVAVAVAGASAAQMLIAMPVGNGVLAVPVAAHSVAAVVGRSSAVRLGFGSTAVLVALNARLSGVDAAEVAVIVAMAVAGAVYIGDATRIAREHDASLIQRLAAVEEQGRLQEQAAVVTQREKAARDLHDSIGHTMSLIVVQAGAGRMTAVAGGAGGVERIVEVLTSIERAARGALRQLDAMLSVIDRSEVIAPVEDLTHALPAMAAHMRAAGTPVDLRLDDLDDVPTALRETVFHLIQEALTNVIKHAPGAAVTIHVGHVGEQVRVRVINTEGTVVGEPLPSGSRGLSGMRERVALMGGHLVAGADQHGGFTVEALLPTDESSASSRQSRWSTRAGTPA
jgi:signal transduction histidine kinase